MVITNVIDAMVAENVRIAMERDANDVYLGGLFMKKILSCVLSVFVPLAKEIAVYVDRAVANSK